MILTTDILERGKKYRDSKNINGGQRMGKEEGKNRWRIGDF